MDEVERNKRLMLLIQKLYKENDVDSIELLKSLVDNDTRAMQFSFKIMLQSTPLSDLFGLKNLSELDDSK